MVFSRHDPIEGPQDLHWTQVYDYVKSRDEPLPEPYDDDAYLERTCKAFVAECELFGWRTSGYCGQIMHETAVLRFPGDVDAKQLNYGGIGATGGGEPGHSFPTPEHGARVNSEHLAVYRYGTRDRWPVKLESYVDPRYDDVFWAGDGTWAGSVREWSDLAGKWAEHIGGYGPGIERHANGMLAMPARDETGGSAITLRVAIASGHHNAQGGNDVEQNIVDDLTERMYYHLSRQPGVEVRSLVVDGPDADTLPGDAYDHRRIYEMWKEILYGWEENENWIPDLTIEQHTQGVGNRDVRGWFGIYPDWGTDVDVDVRDGLIPMMRERVKNYSALPIWSDGIMSEKETGVGIQGYRLGYFSATSYLRSDTERVLIESGAHTNPADRGLLTNPVHVDDIAQAQVMGICDFYGLRYLAEEEQEPEPEPSGLPTTSRGNEVERYFKATDAGILGGFKGRWELLEQHGLAYPHVGLPRSDEFRVDPDSRFYAYLGGRTFQIFERCAFAWNGDQMGSIWEVESIFGRWYNVLVEAAIAQGEYVHGE